MLIGRTEYNFIEMYQNSQHELQSTNYFSKNGKDTAGAIWKIPTEIWWIIFVEATRSQNTLPLQEHMSEAYIPPNFTSLHIAGVCPLWRTIALSNSKLWCDILVTWSDPQINIQRIKHYRSLSGALPKSLVLTNNRTDSQPTTRYLDNLGDVFLGVQLTRVICLLNPGSNDWMSKLLEYLPPISELWVLNNSSCNGGSHGSIPPKHNASLKRLIIDAGSIGWSGNVELEEFTLCHSHHCIGPFPSMSSVMAYTQESRESLKILAVHGLETVTPREECLLSTVHTLIMSLKFMAKAFLPSIKVPNITKIEIPTASRVEVHEWEFLKSSINLKSVKELVCHSMIDHLEMLVEYLSDFTALSRLEIRGSSVDGMLTCMTYVCNTGVLIFPDLKQLIISSYAGSGRAVVPFIQARHTAQQIYGGSDSLFPEILLDGCTHMSLATRLEIRDALASCNGVSVLPQGLSRLSQTFPQTAS